MNKKIIFTSIITFVIMWISDDIIFKIIGDKPANIYINDYFLYLNPLLITVALPVYFFVIKKKDIAIGIIIGGLIYCLVNWFNISWSVSEMACHRYFFNLFTNCPK